MMNGDCQLRLHLVHLKSFGPRTCDGPGEHYQLGERHIYESVRLQYIENAGAKDGLH